jgi:hypothetical protein
MAPVIGPPMPMIILSDGTAPSVTTVAGVSNDTIIVPIEAINGRIDQCAVGYDNVSDVFDDGNPTNATASTTSYHLQLIVTQLL